MVSLHVIFVRLLFSTFPTLSDVVPGEDWNLMIQGEKVNTRRAYATMFVSGDSGWSNVTDIDDSDRRVSETKCTAVSEPFKRNKELVPPGKYQLTINKGTSKIDSRFEDQRKSERKPRLLHGTVRSSKREHYRNSSDRGKRRIWVTGRVTSSKIRRTTRAFFIAAAKKRAGSGPLVNQSASSPYSLRAENNSNLG